ncbi:alpha/beta fold hydrolase [Quatrionicoccus australiensis]|uniref:alpha/beta fold hydrolase n=1 Tax=Quatrionicoccus australiensis TaxID=138118 RepID=UPI001CF8FC5E|nr:alpha/beta fold hydrolase [Quatrionicoccus australiensis]UCV15115.1 alpha/beta fold hydrolase [Quatrionicoccus australiensis]
MNAPLRTVERKTGASTLLVLLPGAYMTAADFATAGFFDAIARRRLALDLVAVDLDLEAISSGTALPALQAQILAPARQLGYSQVWLGGISLGGLLALCHNADTPGEVDGLCLLAPYPGSRLTTNAIARAGGLGVWQASAEELQDPEFRAWQWLQKPPADFPVFVGYGTEDRFAAGMAQIAGCFPQDARCAIPGDHDWPVWQVLWEHFLDSGKLPV